MNARAQQRREFALSHGASVDGWHALPADASPRRYFRVPETAFGPCLLMDVAPGAADFETYIRIAQHLGALGLSAPLVHAHDLRQGLALIEDFGDGTYTNLLESGHDETRLYELAIDTLATLHNAPTGSQIDLPAYDMPTLLREVMLLADWFAPLMPDARNLDLFGDEYQALWRVALADVAERHETLVLRDYHVDNLMLLKERDGIAACGLLDFQDGLIGAAAYDVMSLTQDARRDLSPGLEDHLLARYFAARHGLDQTGFLRSFHLLAAQRHAKVAGIFVRLSQRDGKHHYLAHIPRVLKLLDRALDGANLEDLRRLINHHIPGWSTWTPPA